MYANLLRKSTGEILFGGPLFYHQHFPRPYLAAIDLFVQATGSMGTIVPRLLPFLFQQAAIALWLRVFYEQYTLREKKLWATFMASALLVANGYASYFAFELKPYSADLFFTALLFWAFSTPHLAEPQRKITLGLTTAAALLFSYPAAIVALCVGIATALHPEQRKPWREQVPSSIALVALVCGLAIFSIGSSYRFGYQGKTGAYLQTYWADQMVQGVSIKEKLGSLIYLARAFFTNWWNTDYGPLSSAYLTTGPRTLAHITYNLSNWTPVWMIVLVLVTLATGRSLRKSERPMERLAALTVLALLTLASTKLYPWGQSRLTFFAMPIAIILLVEASGLMRPTRWLFLGAGVILILCNAIFLPYAAVKGRAPANIRDLLPMISTSEADQLVIARGNELVLVGLKSEEIPEGLTIHYEEQLGPKGVLKAVGGKPFYYLWSHTVAPRLSSGGVPAYEKTHHQRILFANDLYGEGLILLHGSPASDRGGRQTIE